MKKRVLIQGLTTTILGVAILVFCGVLVYQGKETIGDLSGWVATGLLFLRSKDSLIGIENKEK